MNSSVPAQYLHSELPVTHSAALFSREPSVEVEFVSVPFLRAGFSHAFATVHIRHNTINCFENITYLQ